MVNSRSAIEYMYARVDEKTPGIKWQKIEQRLNSFTAFLLFMAIGIAAATIFVPTKSVWDTLLAGCIGGTLVGMFAYYTVEGFASRSWRWITYDLQTFRKRYPYIWEYAIREAVVNIRRATPLSEFIVKVLEKKKPDGQGFILFETPEKGNERSALILDGLGEEVSLQV